jgi:hypothetical protein
VVIGEQSALVLEEIQQIGHLLEVRRHIWVIAAQVDIIELDIDDVLNTVSEMALALTRVRSSGPAERYGGQSCDRNRNHPFHLPRSPIPFLRTARRRDGRGT